MSSDTTLSPEVLTQIVREIKADVTLFEDHLNAWHEYASSMDARLKRLESWATEHQKEAEIEKCLSQEQRLKAKQKLTPHDWVQRGQL